jgi:hypothetical protein
MSRLVSDEQSALVLELLCELQLSERGAGAAAPSAGGDDESVRKQRVKDALRRERALEEQKALLRAAVKEDRKEAVAANQAPGASLLLLCVHAAAPACGLTDARIDNAPSLLAQPSCCRACASRCATPRCPKLFCSSAPTAWRTC